MSNQIQNAISIGKETTWGTPVTPTVSVPVNFTGGIQVSNDVQVLSALKTVMAKNLYATKGNVAIEGEYEFPLLEDNIGHFLLSWFGDVDTTGAGPYTHSFLEVPDKISYTVEQNLQDSIERYAGCLVNSLKFTLAVGQPVMVTAGIKAKAYAGSSPITPVYSEVLPFEYGDVAIAVGGNPINELQTMEIELLNNIEMKHTIGEPDNFPQFKYTTGSEVNVTFEGYLNANSKTNLFDPSRSVSPQTIEVTMTKGSSSLYLKLHAVVLTTAETPIAEDYNKVTGEGKALYEPGSLAQLDCTLVNDVASY